MADRTQSGFNTFAVVCCGLAAVAFLFAAVFFLQGAFAGRQHAEVVAKVYEPVNEEVLLHTAEQEAILMEKPRYLDEESGKLCMPITDAMAQVVARENGKR